MKSTGVYGYPKDAAAQVAIRIMREFEGEFEEIIACCFSEADVDLYKRLMLSEQGGHN